MALPLEGVRVLDLSRLVAGGTLGMLLGDFGAEVVKVERPGYGDPLRSWTHQGHPLWWRVYGRNKRSITLNLKHPAGQALLRRLIPRFDVMVESFVPGTLERWGLGWETLQQIHPRLILVRISGWGQTGPDSRRPGFGTLVEASCGFANMNGEADGPPIVPAFPLADMVAALYAANGTLLALYHRDRHGGGGQVVDASLFEGLFSLLGPLAAEYATSGSIRTRQGSRSRNAAPRGVYKTRDGKWLAVSASTPAMAQRFLTAYGLGHLLTDPLFATNEARVQHAEELDRHVAAAIEGRTLAENLELVERQQLTAAPVQHIGEIVAHPHWQARQLLTDVADESGTLPMHTPVPRLSATAGSIRSPAPALGADNASIYCSELGLTPSRLAELQAAGVV